MKREVIHRLASGNKTHSEMAEVSCVLSQRDNAVLCKTFVNPDDASGAALEDALSEVAVRKQRSGAPDEWELRKDAWREYDPAFHHISTRAHQSATENRPKPLPAAPYAPRPASAHSSFKRIRRDLTADSCILAVAYRILHVHCYESNIDSSVSHVRGDSMYDDKSKSETVLARAIHLLTLGAYAWEDASIDNEQSTDWRDLGGGDVGSVFYNREIAPSACDWVAMAFLSDPSEVMSSEWYIGKDNALTLLQKIGFEAGDSCGFLGGIDPALRSGAAYLCKFAAKMNPDAVSASGGLCNSPMKEGEQERKKNAAKEKAMAMMKEKMAKFAANIGNSPGFDDDDMSEDIDESRSPSRGSNEASTFSTPVRNRSDSEIGVLSPAREFNLSSPMASPNSPYTPRTPQMTSPRTTAQNSCPRLMNERPQCIVCGGDSHDDASLSGDLKLNSHTNFLLEGFTSNEKALAFCGYSQASTVFIGGDRVPTRGRITTAHVQSHVGVHITLCGHAIHKDCCDAYLKTVASQRFDRLEGGKKREFRCPLCQRLSNCLIPFVDVAADWTDMVVQKKHSETNVSSSFSSADESLMQIDFRGEAERTQIDKSHGCAAALNDFLSSSKWWATRNDMSVSWDGQCTFSANKDDTKPSELPLLSSPRQSLMKLQSKFGKKELVSAWNSVLRTPRLVTRRVRSSSTDRASIFTYDPNDVSRQKESSSDVLRRFIDQVSDVSHRADMRRLGEENLFSNFGEFRHYLSEKAAYNKDNRAAGKEMVDVSPRIFCSVDYFCICFSTNPPYIQFAQWPQCLSTSTLSESRRQELSREKLISKMMLSIQAFTYTCCSEAAEARQLLQQSSTSDMPSILSKFGLSQVSFGGDLLLFPEANPSVDGGYQPFDGRLGKLRYLSLALMAATSPVSLEVVQLCMSFPDAQPDPFDFGSEEKSLIKRAPVAYPILCSHVLTHTTGALIAVCGRARVEEGKYSIDSVADDCRHLIHLGLVARVSQVILARLRLYIDDDLVLEQHVYSLLEQNAMQIIASSDKDEQNWRHFGVAVIRVLLSPAKPEFKPAPPMHCPPSTDEEEVLSHVLHAVEAAKTEVIAFLRDIALICQLLIPNIFCANVECRHDSQERYSAIELFNRYMELFNMENHQLMLESDLLQDIMKSWYAGSIGTSTKRLDFPRAFHGMTWPVTTSVNNPEIPTNSVPLLGNTIGIGLSSRILHLPKSYTDLYATLSEIYPDSEQTAVCLVCGQVSSC